MSFGQAFNIGSSIGSAFSPWINAGIGMISANHQSGKAFGRMLYAMQEQARLNYEYGLKSLENSPTSQRTGLEKAGYNPMLAVQNSTSGANSGWTSSQGFQQDQATDAITNGVRNGTELQQLAINKQQVDAQSDQAYAEADKSKAEKTALIQKMPYISQREKAEISNIEKDSLLKESQIHNIDETTRFIEKNYELQRELGYLQSQTGINIANIGSNATKYASDKSYDATKYATDKGTPPKWVSGVGAALGAGIGMYGAIRGLASGKNLSHSKNYGWYVHKNY